MSAALVVAGVLGGFLAVGGVALLGGLGGDTTVVTETSAPANPGLAPANGRGLTVNQIYEKDSSGVAFVTASPLAFSANRTMRREPSPSTCTAISALRYNRIRSR